MTSFETTGLAMKKSRKIKPAYARTRSKDETCEMLTSTHTLIRGSDPPETANHHEYVKSKTFTVMHDIVTPNFKELRDAGVYVNTPMNSYSLYVQNSYGGMTSTAVNASTGQFIDSHIFSAIDPSLFYLGGVRSNETFHRKIDDTDAYLVAKNNLLANVDKPTFAFGEDIAEFMKTVATLRGLFGGSLNYFQLLDKLIKGKYRHLPFDAALAAAWLEIRYAFRPILYSLYNLSAMIEKKAIERRKRRPEVLRARGYGRNDTTLTNSYTVSQQWLKWEEEIVENVTTNVYCGCIYSMKVNENPILGTLGLRFQDVPVTMWNLMPYSWVCDHFINLSKIIPAVITLNRPDLTVHCGWTKTVKQRQLTRKLTGVRPNNSWNASSSGGDVSENLVELTISRNPDQFDFGLSRLPEVPLTFNVDLAFLADILALLVGFSQRSR